MLKLINFCQEFIKARKSSTLREDNNEYGVKFK